MKKRFIAYAELAAAFILAGSSVTASKLMMNNLPVYLASGLSLIVAVIVLFPAALIVEGGIPRISIKDIFLVLIQALAGMFLFRVFVLLGLKYTSAIEGGIITSTTPAVVGILAFLILKEKLQWNKILGIICTVAGIVIINIIQISPRHGEGLNPLLGNALVFLAVVGEASFSVLSKKSGNRIKPIMNSALVSTAALIYFLPLSTYEAVKFDFSSMGLISWLIVLYFGVFVTAVAYILWFRGISKVPASTAAVFTGFMPVSAALSSSLILGEKLMPTHFLSILFVISGIILISLPQFDFLNGKVMVNSDKI